ncbi:MAG: hypothetical protein C4B59_14605 [Candidatus Methanogaster sp.]|uniref:Uncharacterized protein n=1 Tax=Candidatus Methanogaster sp. TaxID=3386292 RepID=A0AC61KZA3_9EURY|nr:MAG: hypothetical protein C4B59_14605 [ANME-2 cluster archaeon]
MVQGFWSNGFSDIRNMGWQTLYKPLQPVIETPDHADRHILTIASRSPIRATAGLQVRGIHGLEVACLEESWTEVGCRGAFVEGGANFVYHSERIGSPAKQDLGGGAKNRSQIRSVRRCENMFTK